MARDLFLDRLREAAFPSQRVSSRYYPSRYESLHFLACPSLSLSLSLCLLLDFLSQFFLVFGFCFSGLEFRKCRTGFWQRVVELERKRREDLYIGNTGVDITVTRAVFWFAIWLLFCSRNTQIKCSKLFTRLPPSVINLP